MAGTDVNCGLCYNRPCFSTNSTLTPTPEFVSSCTGYLSSDILQTLAMIGLPGFCEVCKGSMDQLTLFVDQLNRIQNNIEQLTTKINQDVAIQRTIHQNKKARTAKSFPGVSQNINEEFDSNVQLMTRTEIIQSAATDKFSTSGSEKINNTHYEKSATSNNFDDQLDWSHSPTESDKSPKTGTGDDITIKSSEILTHMKKPENGFKCENCSRTFSRLTILKSHDCTKDTYDCDTCGFSFSGPSVLKLHISRTHSREKPFKCDMCDKTFGFKHHLARHIRMHTGEKPFECPECEKKFACQTELAKHKIKHKNIRFPCEVCGKSYADMPTLRLHLKTHLTDADSTNLKCDICQKTFCRPIHLRRHKETVHSEDKPTLYFCEYCGKSFNNSYSLKHHMLRHTSEQNVECDICSKVFSCPQYLKQHKTKNHSKLETVVCDVCGKNYRNQQHYRHHYRQCHRDVVFECQTCGKKYKRSQDLADHVSIIHRKENPYKCDLCEESFKFRIALKRHKIKAHLAVIDKNKFFTCKVCSEPFESSAKLLNHQLQLHNVTSEEFVECQNCSQKFAELGVYEWHICKKPFIAQKVRCNTCEDEKDDENDILTFANYCEFFAHLKYCHDDLEPEHHKCKHCGLVMPFLKIKTHECNQRDNATSENKLNLKLGNFLGEEMGETKTAETIMEKRSSPRISKTVQKPKIKKYCENVADSDEDVYSNDEQEENSYLAEEGDEKFVIKSEIESSCDSDSDEMSSTDVKVKIEAQDEYLE